MTYTDNYNLKKPAQTEFVNVDDLNDNADAIDEQMKVNADAISAEATRAEGAEDTLSKNLSSEIARAKAAEQANADNITAEATRAKAAEDTLTKNLSAEATRAAAAESANATNISALQTSFNNLWTVVHTW